MMPVVKHGSPNKGAVLLNVDGTRGLVMVRVARAMIPVVDHGTIRQDAKENLDAFGRESAVEVKSKFKNKVGVTKILSLL